MRDSLPTPPEGHFWRVKEVGMFGAGIATQLRKRMRFGSRLIYSREFLKGDTAEQTRRVPIIAARLILEQIQADRESERIVGDYPPKVWK